MWGQTPGERKLHIFGKTYCETETDVKNVEMNVMKARSATYLLLNDCFVKRSWMMMDVQMRVYRTYIRSVLTSGLGALAIRHKAVQELEGYHNASLRSVLSLNKTCPSVLPLLLLGELPAEAHIVMDTLNKFYGFWTCRETERGKAMREIMMQAKPGSQTWIYQVRWLCKLVDLPDPALMWDLDIPSKSEWKAEVKFKVTKYFAEKTRTNLMQKSSLKYFNPSAHCSWVFLDQMTQK